MERVQQLLWGARKSTHHDGIARAEGVACAAMIAIIAMIDYWDTLIPGIIAIIAIID